jgi:hypothetical protein
MKILVRRARGCCSPHAGMGRPSRRALRCTWRRTAFPFWERRSEGRMSQVAEPLRRVTEPPARQAAATRTELPARPPVPTAVMRRALGGFSSDGDSVLVIGADAGWWLTSGAGLDRRLTGITMPSAARAVAWYRRMPCSQRDINPDSWPTTGTCSLAVITVAGASPAEQSAAGWVPAAFIRNLAQAATTALCPGGHLAVVIADTVPDGWPQRAQHDGHCVRAPRIPGLLPHRHIIMAPAVGDVADRQPGRASSSACASPRHREHGQRMHPAWHLLIYAKPGQVIPFPRARQG